MQTCDLCHKDCGAEYSDAQIPAYGSWANVCRACAKRYGVRYGLGLGQRYLRQPDGSYLKDSRVKARKASAGAVKYADFKSWFRAVDNAVAAKCGLGCDDLPDYDFTGAYEDGRSPAAVARAVIKNAGE